MGDDLRESVAAALRRPLKIDWVEIGPDNYLKDVVTLGAGEHLLRHAVIIRPVQCSALNYHRQAQRRHWLSRFACSEVSS